MTASYVRLQGLDEDAMYRNQTTGALYSGAALMDAEIKALPGWKDSCGGEAFLEEVRFLRRAGVFLSSPIDLDFIMIRNFPESYGASEHPLEDGDDLMTAVLGKSGIASHYGPRTKSYFQDYHRLFKLGSKPVAHLQALANLTSEQLVASAPKALKDLCKQVVKMLEADAE